MTRPLKVLELTVHILCCLFDKPGKMQNHCALCLALTTFSVSLPAATPKLDHIKPVLFELEPNARYTSTDLRRWEVFTRAGVQLSPSLSLEFVGVDRRMRLEGQGDAASKLSVYMGDDATKWRTDRASFEAVAYRALYPGIDLVYRRLEGKLKGDFIIEPGADTSLIRFRFPGAQVRVEGDRLVIRAEKEMLEERIPSVYEIGGNGHTVRAHYQQFNDGSIGFTIDGHDPLRQLVIDPDLSFSTFLAGSLLDQVTALAYSQVENVLLVTGWTESGDLYGASSTSFKGSTDGYYARLTVSVNGSITLNSVTLFGGTGADKPLAIFAGPTGAVVIGGSTSSTNFPLISAYQARLKGTSDGFLMKFPPYSSTCTSSTYIGGTGTDLITAVAIDQFSTIFFGGNTSSKDLLTLGARQPANAGGSTDGFVGTLTSGATLGYLTYLGGAGTDSITGLALLNGEVYLTGGTDSYNFPITNQSSSAGQDAFVTKLTSSGQLAYSTYLGGSGGTTGAPEIGNAIAVTSAGEAYVTGMTSSLNFPVVNATQAQGKSNYSGILDAFLTKFTSSGAIAFSTYWGGTSWDEGKAIVLLPSGYVAIGGLTSSYDFPTSGPIGAGPGPAESSGGYDGSKYAASYEGFVSVFSPTGVPYWSTFLGGSGSDSVAGITSNPIGEIFVGGLTGSYDFPKVNAFQQNISSTGYHGFLGKISLQKPQYGIFRANTGQFWMVRNADWLPTTGISKYYPIDWTNVCPPGTSSNDAIPVVGDWDGTGRQRLGIFRRSTNTWYLDINGDDLYTPGVDLQISTFGSGIFNPANGGYPVVGDWTSTGRSRLGYFQGGLWFLDINGDGVFAYADDWVKVFGAYSDFPIVGDWDNTGRQRLGTFGRAYVVGDGVTWSLDLFADFAEGRARKFQYGYSTDYPVFADWGNAGLKRIGVYHSLIRAGSWDAATGGNYGYTAGDAYYLFGLTGDVPVTGVRSH